MARTHFKIHFLDEKPKSRAEKLSMRGGITKVMLTSSGGFAGRDLGFWAENGILK